MRPFLTLLAADHVSILHNLTQVRVHGEQVVAYEEKVTSEGPQHEPRWKCWIRRKYYDEPRTEVPNLIRLYNLRSRSGFVTSPRSRNPTNLLA